MSVAPSSTQNHIVLAGTPAWGHIRPLCVLAVRIVNERRDVIITLFSAPGSLLDKTLKEIARQAEDVDDVKRTALNRIRVIAPFKTEEKELFKVTSVFTSAYRQAYKALLNEQSLTCLSTGTTFDAVPPPSLVIVDFFWTNPNLHSVTKELSPSVPVLAWATGNAATLIRRFGPASLGGVGANELGTYIDQEAKKSGRNAEDVGDEIFRKAHGSIVEIEGLPAMYDWEYFPQILPFPVPLSNLLREGAETLASVDGMIIASSEAFERETLEAVRHWFEETNRPVYVLGPLLPAGYGVSKINADKDDKIDKFLNDMLGKYGEDSLLFISFGTVFWPTVGEYVDEVVEALLENDVPFIFCHASPLAQISEMTTKRVEASGFGLLSSWVPQQAILNHPATGWYLTHGGQGGVTESLASGIPMILWPLSGDQPATALHVSENLKAGIELVEVRTGLGLKPLKRNGRRAKGTKEAMAMEFREVLRDIRGDRGAEMRKNAAQLKLEFGRAWGEGGVARSEMERMFERYL